jgi:sulfatase modifying factor 1
MADDGRASATELLQRVLSRGLIDEAQAREVSQTAFETRSEPSTILLARGLITPEALHSIQSEIDFAKTVKIIGGHRLIGTLGRGGMGVVYRAIQLSVERTVALKVLGSRLACQPEFAERFLREAKTAARINSPHVVTVHDAGWDGEQLYLAMELVEGGDAAGLMAQSGGMLSPQRATEILADAALGLEAIFRAGLIHRDIKPANIFLTEKGQAKLADLGLSRQISGDDRVTIAGEILGTPAFMSPEQAEGRELDIRSDIYSLGATLYTLLTGRSPYASSTPMGTAAMVITEDFPDPLMLRPNLPLALAEVIARATQRRPEDRYQTPAELSEELEHILEHVPLLGDDATGITLLLKKGLHALRPGRRRRRRRALAMGLIIGLGVLLAAGAGGWWAWRLKPAGADGGAAAVAEAARLRGEITARLIAVGDRQDAAKHALERAQARGRQYAADAADHRVPPELAAYMAVRQSAWDRYVAGLQDDPRLVAIDAAIKTARAFEAANPQSAMAALATAEEGLDAWSGHHAQQLAELFAQPLFTWCLDRGRERQYAPLIQAQLDLGDLAVLGRSFLQGSTRDLRILDQAVALPEGIGDELDLTAAVLGENNADVQRWRRKLAEVRALRTRCAAIAQAQAQDPAADDAAAVAALVALVGAAGAPEIAPAQARLGLHQELLGRLAALSPGAPPPPTERLAGLGDDLQRWEAAFGSGAPSQAWRQRLAEARRWDLVLRPALEAAERSGAASGAPGSPLDAALIDEALQAARRLVLPAPDLERWRRAVALGRLRARCAVFLAAAEPGADAVEALPQLASLAGAADPEVVAGQAKLDERERLLATLAALGSERPLPAAAQLGGLGQALARWTALFGPSGARVAAWQRRLALADGWSTTQAVLAACDRGVIDPGSIGAALAAARTLRGDQDAQVLAWTAKVSQALPFWPADWAAQLGEDRAGYWADLAVGPQTQRLRWIPPGSFLMGSPPRESGREGDEQQHQVSLTAGFWLAETPCTQGLWQSVMGGNPSHALHDPRHPVDSVSWDQCQAFLAALAQRVPGAPARLPSEAEWEYACRAGSSGATYGPPLDAIAWYSANSDGEPQQVRLKAPNAWGLYDMLGNVDQWCSDFYHEFNGSALSDPAGPVSGSERVYRGGAFDSDEEFCRCARRASMAPARHRPNLGLRIAIAGPPPAASAAGAR